MVSFGMGAVTSAACERCPEFCSRDDTQALLSLSTSCRVSSSPAFSVLKVPLLVKSRRPSKVFPSCCHSQREHHRILLLGGTGRVGESTADVIGSMARGPCTVSIVGRDIDRAKTTASRLTARHRSNHLISFAPLGLDIGSEDALVKVMKVHDTVVHTAGPFQRSPSPSRVLSAAIRSQCKYIDVCDDLRHAEACRILESEALKAGVPCWICTGIYPGISNLMASACVKLVDDAPSSVRYYYYTAGTGGIGATVLASTFLILSETVTTFDMKGNPLLRLAAGDVEAVDFGGKIGLQRVFNLHLPEITSTRRHLCDGQVVAKFSTGPPVWNWLLRATARLVPGSILANKDMMLAFSNFSLPIVRAVDRLSGARTGIRVDVDFRNGSSARSVYEHESLRTGVGAATASFTTEMIWGPEPGAGVFVPEQLPSSVCEAILRNAVVSTDRFEAPSVWTTDIDM